MNVAERALVGLRRCACSPRLVPPPGIARAWHSAGGWGVGLCCQLRAAECADLLCRRHTTGDSRPDAHRRLRVHSLLGIMPESYLPP